MEQRILTTYDSYREMDEWIKEEGIRRLLLVCDASIYFLKKMKLHMDELDRSIGIEVITFSDFQPNPLYDNVVAGVRLFREHKCDGIIALGGGSAMDVAKCIKLYSNMNGDGDEGSFLKQDPAHNEIPFLAIPTTAGTGSEATRYAVIYYEGKKQSITSESIIPDAVLMNPDCLVTLPDYQKKATMMDALCHAIESYWSVNSTDESMEYSRQAIKLIIENMDDYLGVSCSEQARRNMLMAANIAGKAINITQTTAGHAMCYKLTSMFGVAHGHAAALCDRVLYEWMVKCLNDDNTDFADIQCLDPRGKEHLVRILDEIGHALGCKDAYEGARKLVEIFDRLELSIPDASEEQYEELKTSVNPDRLKNHPVKLDEKMIDSLYHMVLT